MSVTATASYPVQKLLLAPVWCRTLSSTRHHHCCEENDWWRMMISVLSGLSGFRVIRIKWVSWPGARGGDSGALGGLWGGSHWPGPPEHQGHPARRWHCHHPLKRTDPQKKFLESFEHEYPKAFCTNLFGADKFFNISYSFFMSLNILVKRKSSINNNLNGET